MVTLKSRTPFTKKSVHQINASLLAEPAMSAHDWHDYKEGWRLFNEGQFWHAHEAWESVWKRCPEESRIFFQGVIQLAAAYHLLTAKQRYGGAVRNFEKAEEKLRLFHGRFLLVETEDLLTAISNARKEINRIGKTSLHTFNTNLLPTVNLTMPS